MTTTTTTTTTTTMTPTTTLTTTTTTTTTTTATTTTTNKATKGETTGKVYQKSQGQIKFEEQLKSQRGCFQEEDSQRKESVSQTATAKQGKPLPVIDLFLNPKRTEEKEELLKSAKKQDTGTYHTKVKLSNLNI